MVTNRKCFFPSQSSPSQKALFVFSRDKLTSAFFHDDFDELKEDIVNLPKKEQLKILIEAKTEYLQNKNPFKFDIMIEVPFDKKCDLEIQKIKELMKIDAKDLI